VAVSKHAAKPKPRDPARDEAKERENGFDGRSDDGTVFEVRHGSGV
jgi:hypothetical protein